MLPDSQSSIQRTNNSSPCYLFLAACCVISLDNPKTKEKLWNPSHCIQLCPSNLKNKAHFPKVQLRDKHWINTDEENPDDWSDSRNPKLPYSRFYAHTVNALSSERRLARETSCCAVTRSAKTPEEPPVQVSAADSWGCPDIDLLVFLSVCCRPPTPCGVTDALSNTDAVQRGLHQRTHVLATMLELTSGTVNVL